MGVETQLDWVQPDNMKCLVLLFVSLPVVVPGAAQENNFSLFDPFELINRINPHRDLRTKSAPAANNARSFDPFQPFNDITTTRKPRRRVKTSRPRLRPTTRRTTTSRPETTKVTTTVPTTTVKQQE